MPVNQYKQRIRESGERFLVHLCNSGNFQEIWDRDELTDLYYSSPCRGHSFSRVLYHMSWYPPKLLHVRKGTTVHFQRPTADSFYWTQLMSMETELIVKVKCESEGSSVKQLDRRHFVCEVDETSMPCVLGFNFASTSIIPCSLVGFSYAETGNFLDDLLPRKLRNGSVSISDFGTQKLLFHFEKTGIAFSFALVVDVKTACAESLTPKIGRTSAKQTSVKSNVIGVVNGTKPTLRNMGNLKMTRTLENFSVPRDLDQVIQNHGKKRQSISCVPLKYHSIMESSLTSKHYDKKFHLLMHLEELQYIQDIKYYSMVSAFKRNGKFLSVEVPGLAERRPSILRGDRIFVRKMKDDKPYGSYYEGFVHNIQQTTIQVRFDKSLHEEFIQGMKFSIHFIFNRHPLKLMHRAVEIISDYSNMEMFFPVRSGTKDPILPRRKIVTKNRDIEKNEAQLSAVTSILQETSSPIYLIYGPPGTGKTVTMVESIFQTLDAFPDCHILVCAPSNSACDLLTERLLKHVDKRSIHRLHAPSRGVIPEFIIEVSNIGPGNEIFFQSKEELMKFKVIVCTLITAGRLASAKFPDDHFKRIFIDESGQSMEPELLVAVSGILSRDGKLVLAGDPKQLGPIVRSAIAKTKGLQLSLLERLMNTLPYERQENGKYNPHYVTKLMKNYRSHEAIVKLPNEEFYDGELEVCADEMSRYSLCRWEELPRPRFPIIFKHVDGRDEREENSPSFFNSSEVVEVKRYVTSLLEERRYKVRASEIGVITPYRKQVQKIRRALNNNQIKVGSVEEFQGQERRVIIISTVRSQEENLKHDAIFHLGFVADAKRFNVAITRAKSLLIIVGNAKLLCKDSCWRKMYRYCKENGGYVGPRFSDDDSRILDVFNMVEEHVLNDVEWDVEDMNNPEWRLDP